MSWQSTLSVCVNAATIECTLKVLSVWLIGFTSRLLTETTLQLWKNRAKPFKSFTPYAASDNLLLPPSTPSLPPLFLYFPTVDERATDDTHSVQRRRRGAAGRHDGRHRETSHDKHFPNVSYSHTHTSPLPSFPSLPL